MKCMVSMHLTKYSCLIACDLVGKFVSPDRKEVFLNDMYQPSAFFNKLVLHLSLFALYDGGLSSASHYREVARWEIFMEQELRFGLDMGRFGKF